MPVTSKGLASATQVLEGLDRASAAAATRAVNVAAEGVAKEARRRTRAIYNLSEQSLKRYIRVRLASIGRTRATVTLEVTAVPVSEFGARVAMRTFNVNAFHNARVRRQLPTVSVKLFRRGGRRTLKGAFPLRQRRSGPLATDERVRRRIGSAKSWHENRSHLTGFRFVTFPPKFLKRLRPELQTFAGTGVSIEFRSAWRDALGRQRSNRGITESAS